MLRICESGERGSNRGEYNFAGILVDICVFKVSILNHFLDICFYCIKRLTCCCGNAIQLADVSVDNDRQILFCVFCFFAEFLCFLNQGCAADDKEKCNYCTFGCFGVGDATYEANNTENGQTNTQSF